MKPRDIAKALAVAGWASGIVLILAGAPVVLAIADCALVAAAAVAFARYGASWMTRAKARASRLLARHVKTGSVVERA